MLLLVTGPDAELLLVFIEKKELHLKQGEDSFCQKIVLALNGRTPSLSRLNAKEFYIDLPTVMSNYLFRGSFINESCS